MEQPGAVRPDSDVEPYPMALIPCSIADHVNRKVPERTALAHAAIACGLSEPCHESSEEIGVKGERAGKHRVGLAEFAKKCKPAVSRSMGPPPGLTYKRAQIPKPKIWNTCARPPLL